MTNGIRIYIGEGDLDKLHEDLESGPRSAGWIGRDEHDHPVEVTIIDVNQEEEFQRPYSRVDNLDHLQNEHAITDATLLSTLAGTTSDQIDEWLLALHAEEHQNAEEA